MKKQTSRKTYKHPYPTKTRNEPENISLRTVANIRTSYQEGKTIAVSKLPDCSHKTLLIEQLETIPDARICVLAIKRGVTEKWIAYAGYPDVADTKFKDDDMHDIYYWSCQNIRNVEQVKMLGEILDKEAAKKLFPDWDIKQYTPKLLE